MMPISYLVRPIQKKDWPEVLDAANASAPWAIGQNINWLKNRQEFDETTWHRRHYVLLDLNSDKVIGYGGVEEGPLPEMFRVFVVMDPTHLNSDGGSQLFEQLLTDLLDLKASEAWIREDAGDKQLLEFFARKHFLETSRVTLQDGMEVVRMSLHLPDK
jgi:hypothetical protein